MMDIGSLYMLLNGMGGGAGLGGQQPQQPQMPILGRMGRMTGGGLGFGGHPDNMDPAWLDNPTFGASAYKNVPVSYGGTPMHPDMVGNSGMPILNASSAPQQGQQQGGGQQGGMGDMASLMMMSGGLNMLFDALRGS